MVLKIKYRTRTISGRGLYCFKVGFGFGFPLKNKIKAHPSNENKQLARSITERPEMARVRYVGSDLKPNKCKIKGVVTGLMKIKV